MVRLYLQLSKAFLSSLVLLTTAVGYALGRAGSGAADFRLLESHFLWTIFGTGLAAAGANALNQWLERGVDAMMERTRSRPLPAGMLSPRQALRWGLGTSVGGVVILASLVNVPAALLALGVILLYTLVYTPLKRRSTLCTLAGAVCGAVPPVIGWVAVAGRFEAGALLLGATLFIWQIPHFFALAWMYRYDYARGGFRMLPVVDSSGRLTFNAILLFSLILIPLGLTVTLIGMTGFVFAAGSLLLGVVWLGLGFRLWWDGSAVSARNVFLGSLVYLPLLLGLMVLDRSAGDRAGDMSNLAAVTEITDVLSDDNHGVELEASSKGIEQGLGSGTINSAP